MSSLDCCPPPGRRPGPQDPVQVQLLGDT
jgi:hypothetical protein